MRPIFKHVMFLYDVVYIVFWKEVSIMSGKGKGLRIILSPLLILY